MVRDSLSDMVIQIKNAYLAGKTSVILPWSRVRQDLAQVLVEEGFLAKTTNDKQQLTLDLKYSDQTPALTGIRRVSKPGARIYSQVKNFPRVLGGLGINIITTPKGVVSDKKARKLNVGGEIIAQVW